MDRTGFPFHPAADWRLGHPKHLRQSSEGAANVEPKKEGG
jgi:hypothetical protein